MNEVKDMYHSLIDIDLLEKGLHEKETPDRHRGFSFYSAYMVYSYIVRTCIVSYSQKNYKYSC